MNLLDAVGVHRHAGDVAEEAQARAVGAQVDGLGRVRLVSCFFARATPGAKPSARATLAVASISMRARGVVVGTMNGDASTGVLLSGGW